MSAADLAPVPVDDGRSTWERVAPPVVVDPEEQEREDRRGIRYVPTEVDRYLVSCLSAEGFAEEVIARTLNRPHGVTVETLQRHYSRELIVGRADIMGRAHATMAVLMQGTSTVTINGVPTTEMVKPEVRLKAAHILASRTGMTLDKKGGGGEGGPFARAGLKLGTPIGDIEFTLDIGEHEPLDTITIEKNERENYQRGQRLLTSDAMAGDEEDA
jgi:hypothetical protein